MENKKTPYIVNAEPKTYAFCTCGKSSNLPFCNGAHSDTEHTPIIEVVTENKTIAICSCGQSKNGIYCDGSHKNINN